MTDDEAKAFKDCHNLTNSVQSIKEVGNLVLKSDSYKKAERIGVAENFFVNDLLFWLPNWKE